MILFNDAETYSECDLKLEGQYAYAEHPSTEILMWSLRSLAWDDSLVFEDDLYDTIHALKESKRVKWTKSDPLTLVHWGAFDRIVQGGVRETPDGWLDDGGFEWLDLREVSLTCGGPGQLAAAAMFWGGSQLKGSGSNLIKRFSIPQSDGSRITKHDDPILWEEFRAYARQDTNVMVDIYNTMLAHVGHDMIEHWEAARCIGRMNERGVPVDRPSASIAIDQVDTIKSEIKEEIESAYGFSPTSPKAVKDFLGTEDCRAETLEALLASPECDDEQREIIQARQLVGGAATAKLKPMLGMSASNGRIRGCFDYHGAHTRRLTSFGVQLQNMLRSPSNEDFFTHLNDPALGPDACGDTALVDEIRRNIRGFICAPEGSTFVAADYSQIELRYGAWVAAEGWMLDAFRENDKAVEAHGKKSPEAWQTDLYVKSAANLSGLAIEDVGDEERQFGKTVELACEFGISAVGRDGEGGLKAYAAARGIDMDDEGAWAAWNIYRRTHPYTVSAWDSLEDAIQRAINLPEGTRIPWKGHVIERGADWVRTIRPSGFSSYLWSPRLVPALYDDGNPRKDSVTGEQLYSIEYIGRLKNGVMGTKRTWGSNEFQTCVQGGAADLMLEGMVRAEAGGFPPVLSVHDEVVTEVKKAAGGEAILLKQLCEILTEAVDWAPGLPLSAEGWYGRRFTK